MQFSRTWVCLALLALICSFTPNSALAQDGLDSGDTAWILISTGLVLFMMIPSLAMFYAGLVRSRNVLSIFMHCFGITALITVIWTLCGYSLAFTANNPFIGDLSKSFLLGITGETLVGYIPELLFFVFQMAFAIITPGLFVGAFAERMKFSAIMWFSGLWCLLVYMPITHMVWGEAGFFSTMGVFRLCRRHRRAHHRWHSRPGRQWPSGHGRGRHPDLAQRPRFCYRRHRRPGGHNPGLGLGRSNGRHGHRLCRQCRRLLGITWLKQAIGYDDALDVGAQFGTQAFAAATAIYPRSSPLSCSKSSTSSSAYASAKRLK